MLLRRYFGPVHGGHELDVLRVWVREQNRLGHGLVWTQSLAGGVGTFVGV